MTLILFALTLALLVAAIADRWRRRPVLLVSTHSGETFSGHRALTLRFTLEGVKLIEQEADPFPLGGRMTIPRRNITLVQALPEDVVDVKAPAAESA